MANTKHVKNIWLAGLGVSLFAFLAVSLNTNSYADTANTTISSVIGSTISLFTTNTTVNINALPTTGGVQTTASDTVTVSTNNSTGYTLKLAETNAASALVSGGNSIPATSGTFASPIALTANTWGYHVDGLGTFGTGGAAISNTTIGAVKYAAVPATASPQTLKTTATTATSDTSTVWYSLAVNTSTPSGTYTNSVTYTATTNP